MINEADELEAKIKREVALKDYQGPDRVVESQEKWETVLEDKNNRPAFSASMGLPTLDTCTDGFRLGQLVIVSGPPKNGKTLLCQNLTSRFTNQKHRCVWFEYELNYEEFLGKFKKEDLDFYIPNQIHRKDLSWIEDRIIEAKLKFGADIVFIDHLDFLREPKQVKNVSTNLAAYVGAIVQEVKTMAVQHNMLIFLMSHIRKNNWTSGKLPTSEELRDSGQIAQLADMVMMVMRKRTEAGQSDEIYLDTDAVIGVIENRHNGKTKMVNVQLMNGEFLETTDQKLNEPIKEKSLW